MTSSWRKAVYTWFIQQRSSGTWILGPLLQEKVKHFSTQLNTEAADREFKASTGWLEKFKTWHGIRKYLNWQFLFVDTHSLSLLFFGLSGAREHEEVFFVPFRFNMFAHFVSGFHTSRNLSARTGDRFSFLVARDQMLVA